MNGSPPQPPSGPNSVTPKSGGPPNPAVKRKPPPNIFTQKKKPLKKRPLPANKASAPNDAAPSGLQQAQTHTNGVGASAAEPEKKPQKFKIYVMKDTLRQGLHYHAMRLHSRPVKDGSMRLINPYDESQFTRPVRLHRRNARDKRETAEQSDAASGVDDKERELLTARRAERQAEREANQALIAPTGGEAKKAVKRKPQKKVEDVYYDENDPRQKQRAQLRYEEARPWHLEDFDGNNVWVGSYEEPLSESSVMFEFTKEGFNMVPVEKWYKFTQTNRVNVMDSDAVEKHMGKKYKAPRWFLGTQDANDEARRKTAMAKRAQAAAQRHAADDDEDGAMGNREEYHADVDEIDFEFNDEFQDDDEGFILGDPQDDEAKEAEKKIRDEQRQANLAGTGVKDEDKDWDEEEQKERLAEQEDKRRTKKLRKQLIKKERKQEYDSESERGEFSESSESEDSEEERERLEEERKLEEARKVNVNGDKSGASTKGSNTPTGRAEKRDDAKNLGATLKRPGSPDLSELSGNESSRKKAKGPNGRANPPNNARSLSREFLPIRPLLPAQSSAHAVPADVATKPPVPRASSGGYGSGSETDNSRSGRPKIRIKQSRPGSPAAPSSRGPSPGGSRAQSPQRDELPLPTLDEVRAAVPLDGITVKGLVDQFQTRVAKRQKEFIQLVKSVVTQDHVTKKVYLKAGEREKVTAGRSG